MPKIITPNHTKGGVVAEVKVTYPLSDQSPEYHLTFHPWWPLLEPPDNIYWIGINTLLAEALEMEDGQQWLIKAGRLKLIEG